MPNTPPRLQEFKRDLTVLQPRQIVQKHITFGETEVLDRAQHFYLRNRVADHFGIHPQSITVVGSAKLGFSIKPSRRYGPFGENSDVDIAIVSKRLYVRYWRELKRFVDNGGYWEKLPKFQARFFDGWIRPDLMPRATDYSPTAEWWEFFRELTNSQSYGPYKISAGLYYDWDSLERYQLRAVISCTSEATV